MKPDSGLKLLGMITVVAVLWGQWSCTGPCRTAQQDYEEVLGREARLVDGERSTLVDAHFIVGMSETFLTTTANELVAHRLEKALTSSTETEKASSGVRLELKPQVGPVKIDVDGGCDSCVRVTADLGGRLDVILPIVGRQGGDLGGELSFVAPVEMVELESGEFAVRFAPAAGGNLEKPRIRLRLPWLSGRWLEAVEERLSTLIQRAVFERFEVVTLARFEAPEIGIEGLRLSPLGVFAEEATGVLRFAFASNLEVGGERGGQEARLHFKAPRAELFVGVRRDLMAALMQVMLQNDVIPRRYNLQGNSDGRGRIHVTVEEFSMTPAMRPGGQTALRLGFHLWSLGRWGSCFSVPGVATGRVVLDGQELGVEIDRVVFSDSSLASPANWVASRFLVEGSVEVLRQGLERNVPMMEGVSLRLHGHRLVDADDYVALTARGEVAKSAPK